MLEHKQEKLIYRVSTLLSTFPFEIQKECGSSKVGVNHVKLLDICLIDFVDTLNHLIA